MTSVVPKSFAALVGRTISKVEGLEEGSSEVVITLSDGRTCRLFHIQDCCEDVSLVDVSGDPDHLIGRVLLAYKETQDDASKYDSRTWTFYRIQTEKGHVIMRWLGVSNGYYSEEVDVQWSDQ